MMELPRDVHAESSVLHEPAPRRRPLQHATISLPLLPLWVPTPILKIRKRCTRGDPVTITGRSNAIISKSSSTSLGLLRAQDSPSCGPYGLFSHKSTGLNPKSPALAAKLLVEQISMICAPPLSVNNAPTSSIKASLASTCLSLK